MQGACRVISVLRGVENPWGTGVTRLWLLSSEQGSRRLAPGAFEAGVLRCPPVLLPLGIGQQRNVFGTGLGTGRGQGASGQVNSGAWQGGALCAEQHLLAPCLCFREMPKREVHPPFSLPPACFPSLLLPPALSGGAEAGLGAER